MSKLKILETIIRSEIRRQLKENDDKIKSNMSLEDLKAQLEKHGYHVDIPGGGDRIAVFGYGKGFFQAKKDKAASILSGLKSLGYNAEAVKDEDGYYDFWVSLN